MSCYQYHEVWARAHWIHNTPDHRHVSKYLAEQAAQRMVVISTEQPLMLRFVIKNYFKCVLGRTQN